jgi:hypothetical protein
MEDELFPIAKREEETVKRVWENDEDKSPEEPKRLFTCYVRGNGGTEKDCVYVWAKGKKERERERKGAKGAKLSATWPFKRFLFSSVFLPLFLLSLLIVYPLC